MTIKLKRNRKDFDRHYGNSLTENIITIVIMIAIMVSLFIIRTHLTSHAGWIYMILLVKYTADTIKQYRDNSEEPSRTNMLRQLGEIILREAPIYRYVIMFAGVYLCVQALSIGGISYSETEGITLAGRPCIAAALGLVIFTIIPWIAMSMAKKKAFH